MADMGVMVVLHGSFVTLSVALVVRLLFFVAVMMVVVIGMGLSCRTQDDSGDRDQQQS